ncbi:hypothetical protein [Radicibacter daui]|uniref:hypothetical protein n=1 Tax=Radicibacter daui TaxID=3064829 RepID=UPI004046CCED
MDNKRLLEIIAAYGSDAARWPAAERDDALALLESSAPAGVLENERGLDSLLAAVANEPLPQGYLQRLNAVLTNSRPQQRAAEARKPFMAVRLAVWLRQAMRPAILRPAAGLCTAAVIGLVAGTLVPPPSTGATGGTAYNDQDDLYRPVDVASIAYGSSGYGLVATGQEGWGQ